MSCDCNKNKTHGNCDCEDKLYSSDITFDGSKFVCTKNGENVFTLNACDNLNSVLQKFSERICALGDETPIMSNVIFVDSKYGDDATGEYGNMARPFKTIAAAQKEAVNYMNNNAQFDTSNTTLNYKDTNDADTGVSIEYQPRVVIHVAPGVYNSEDEFEVIYNDTDLTLPGGSVDLTTAKANSSFNLMLNFVDYYLAPSAVLLNYGFQPYSTMASLMGYTDYTYDTTGVHTNVFGNGNIISDKNAWGLFGGAGLPLNVYLEGDVSVKIEGNTIALGGYLYGGRIEVKCKDFIMLPVSGRESGSYNWYFDHDSAFDAEGTSKPSFIEADNLITCYNGETIFDGTPSSFFEGAGHNFKLKVKNYLGRDIDGRIALAANIKKYQSADGILGWFQDYFVNAAYDIALPVCGFYEVLNYSPNKAHVQVEIDSAKLSRSVFAAENDASKKLTIDCKIKHLELVSTSAAVVHKLFNLSGSNVSSNTRLNIEMPYVEVYTKNGLNEIDKFFFLEVANTSVGKVSIKNTKVKVKNTVNVDANSMVCFIGIPVGNSVPGNKVSLQNVVFESENAVSSDYFISVEDKTLNVKYYNDIYSNVANNVTSTVTNLITGSAHVVDADVEAV